MLQQIFMLLIGQIQAIPSYTDFYCVNVTIHGLDYTRILSDAGEDTVYNVPWGLYAQTWEWCQEMISVFDNALTEAFDACSVNGGWSDWSAWGSCDGTERSRSRTCDNPAPYGNGANCVGSSSETESCAHGGWSAWVNGTCNGTHTIDTRTCDNPVPSNGGDNCVGDSEVVEICGLSCSFGGFGTVCVGGSSSIISSENFAAYLDCASDFCENQAESGCCQQYTLN